MVANCPYCSGDFEWEKYPMKKQGEMKKYNLIEYRCPQCGQHFTKEKGKKGYTKGQILSYLAKNKISKK